MKMFKTLSSLLSTFFFFAVILIVVIISNLWRFSQSLPDYRQLENTSRRSPPACMPATVSC